MTANDWGTYSCIGWPVAVAAIGPESTHKNMRTKLFGLNMKQYIREKNVFHLDALDIGAVVEEREDGRVNVSDVDPNKNIKVKMIQVSCEQM